MSHRAAGFAFHGMASRDLELPMTRFAALGWATDYVGPKPGPVDGFDPLRTVAVEQTIAQATVPDALVIPGGFAWRDFAADEQLLAWIRAGLELGGYVIGVSTGALVVAAAGVLADLPATGHWLALDDLEAMGASIESAPMVRSGRVFTAGGALAAVGAVDIIDAELGERDGPDSAH